jgi:iron(III) transport system substrate-binding protein
MRHSRHRGRPVFLLSALLTLCCAGNASLAAEVNIYSARQEALIKPLLDRYTEETGVAVNLVTGKDDALLTRLQSEGRNTPADLLLTTDVGRLYRAQQAGVLRAVKSDYLDSAIPAHLRSSDDYWFGLSVRARAIVYAQDRVKASELSTYEDLADQKWKRRICVRSSGNIYNQSLVASILAADGDRRTGEWLSGFVANFARPPQGGDRDQIKAVAAGQCDIAVVNSYYYGAMLDASDESERAAAAKVSIFWPNQQDRGTHINISGAGVTAAAKHPQEAIQLIEFMARDSSQRWYAQTNNEFPIRPGIEPSTVLKSWGEFKRDPLDVTELGRLNAAAVMAMDRAGWK